MSLASEKTAARTLCRTDWMAYSNLNRAHASIICGDESPSVSKSFCSSRNSSRKRPKHFPIITSSAGVRKVEPVKLFCTSLFSIFNYLPIENKMYCFVLFILIAGCHASCAPVYPKGASLFCNILDSLPIRFTKSIGATSWANPGLYTCILFTEHQMNLLCVCKLYPFCCVGGGGGGGDSTWTLSQVLRFFVQ